MTKTNNVSKQFAPFAERMQAEDLPQIAIDTFAHYYQNLLSGQTGLIPETDIKPVENIPDADTFSDIEVEIGQEALSKAVFIKLNGGLGTSMGLEQAKSLLKVKDSFSFLDIIAQQALQSGIPLILMNSFATQAASLAALAHYPELQKEVPLDFVQHKVPKINQADLSPAICAENPALEWCPPGHGDIYTALVTSGTLDILLAAGYEYAFVSNADNLGAAMNTAILGYFVQHKLPFMMEVADRTEADKKGGHLAQRLDGQLILRESAQCPPDDVPSFQDITRHQYFNTNNLWLNLPALKSTLVAKNHILGLPMIRNMKTVDPRDPDSHPIYQLETAMGSAIVVFPNSQAIRVPRTRFAPVKTTNDLLAVRSNAYHLTDDFRIVLNPKRQLNTLAIILDSLHYKLITDLENHFPEGVPSLVDCTHLKITGDILFGRNIILKGNVTIKNTSNQQVKLANGMLIDNETLTF